MDRSTQQPCRFSRRLAHEDPSPSPPPPTKRRRTSYASKDTTRPSRPQKSEPSNLPEIQTADQKPPEKTWEPQGVFPFMELPAELRVHIYRMALHQLEPLYLHLPPKLTSRIEDDDSCVRGSDSSTFTACRHRPGRHPRYNRRKSDVSLMPLPPRHNITPALLRTCSLVFKEARKVLYSDNHFILRIDSGIATLESLRQRNRSLIKDVALTIPSHHDILDGFADVVRLGLRYCWGLKSLTITLPESFPDDNHSAATNIYANAFHILRWLPKGCKIQMQGHVSDAIRRVVADEGRLMDSLDEKEYLKRQHQMPERH